MLPEPLSGPEFAGFPAFRANVTFVPIQFFTVVVPHCSRGTRRAACAHVSAGASHYFMPVRQLARMVRNASGATCLFKGRNSPHWLNQSCKGGGCQWLLASAPRSASRGWGLADWAPVWAVGLQLTSTANARMERLN